MPIKCISALASYLTRLIWLVALRCQHKLEMYATVLIRAHRYSHSSLGFLFTVLFWALRNYDGCIWGTCTHTHILPHIAYASFVCLVESGSFIDQYWEKSLIILKGWHAARAQEWKHATQQKRWRKWQTARYDRVIALVSINTSGLRWMTGITRRRVVLQTVTQVRTELEISRANVFYVVPDVPLNSCLWSKLQILNSTSKQTKGQGDARNLFWIRSNLKTVFSLIGN